MAEWFKAAVLKFGVRRPALSQRVLPYPEKRCEFGFRFRPSSLGVTSSRVAKGSNRWQRRSLFVPTFHAGIRLEMRPTLSTQCEQNFVSVDFVEPRHKSAAMCNLYSLTKGQAAIRDFFRASMTTRATCRYSPESFPIRWPPLCKLARKVSASSLWRAGACRGRLSTGAAGHQHPQREQSALARVARQAEPLPRASHVVLRVRRDQAAQDADLVRPGRG
jgi:hypothetical protein